MAIDEIYCHRQRELRRWERIGHPLDTLFYLLCLIWILLAPPGGITLGIYLSLSLGSCLFITKDEWQHRELCTGFENWLHALLFMLHPLLLLTAGFLWWSGDALFRPIVGTVVCLSGLFMIYQTLFWNLKRNT